MLAKRERSHKWRRPLQVVALTFLTGYVLLLAFSLFSDNATMGATTARAEIGQPSSNVPGPVVTGISTPTSTRTQFPSPVPTAGRCGRCEVDIRDVSLACNPNGSLHWTAILRNRAQCIVSLPYRVTLQARFSRDERPDWVNVQTRRGFVTLPQRGEIVVFGDFCYTFPSNVDKLRVEFALEGPSRECMRTKNSHDIRPCAVTPRCGPPTPIPTRGAEPLAPVK